MTPNHPLHNESSLDLGRLEKVRQIGNRIVARCPACAEAGHDRRGEHLSIWPSGKFACAAMQGDPEHRRRIFALVGILDAKGRSIESDRRWRADRANEQRQAWEKKQKINAAKTYREKIIARHEWQPLRDSPLPLPDREIQQDPHFFLTALFAPEAVLWTGQVFESGKAHAGRWKAREEWKAASQGERIGPMVTPSTWKLGTSSRVRSNVLTAAYVVLDFDGFDGANPLTSEALRKHIHASLALTRWIREGLDWQLAAVLSTGGKSIHSWFHNPAPDALGSLKAVASALGLDAGLIGSPEHPCRLPGQRHEKTGKYSQVLWLQNPCFQIQ